MKICSISAHNFRTLEDFHLDFSPNYVAISGRNNAGKSAIVRIIEHFFDSFDEDRLYSPSRNRIVFSRDVTQWCGKEEMEISVTIKLDRQDDSEVFFVVETFAKAISSDVVEVTIGQKFKKDGATVTYCKVGSIDLDPQPAGEVLKKLRSAANLVVHNSTSPSHNFYFNGGSITEVLEVYFSDEDRRKIAEAEKGLQTRVGKAARVHKEELEKLLGKLNEKYQVELTSIDRGGASHFPLEIKLTDKSVEVPLNHWGAGTQNRTRVLISVLEAVRIRSSATASERSTPVFLVEEPESFLHPSAQAEFGQVLNELAEEQKIQIIATTHSPYMLNQSSPEANILLERKVSRKLLRETYVKNTSGDDWMLPFAENLGIIPSEFKSWKKVFGAKADRVVFVEGEIDKSYFEILRDQYPKIYTLDHDIEIVPYGGKESLKSTPILQFMVNRLGRVFVTFDLDARNELKSALDRIGLSEGVDYCAIGLQTPGADCIEGLLPAAIKSEVFAREHAHVSALGSQDTKARNSAKSALKQALLSEFKLKPQLEKDLVAFKSLFGIIGAAFK